MASKILSYIYRFIINPGRASEQIAEDKSALWVGFWFVLAFGVLYSVTAFTYYKLEHTPVTTPLLPIPLEKWYLVQTFTTIPVGLAGTLSYVGLAYMFCRALGGKGSFDTSFATQSYTLHIPCLIFMWVPETFFFPILYSQGIHVSPWPQWVENLRVFIFPMPWIFIISTIALSRIHGIRWWRSLIAVLFSSIPTAGIMAVFIR